MSKFRASHPRAIMYAHPWALYDMGVEKAFDELVSCGIDAIHLALTYHIATYLTPRNPKRKVLFGEQGAVFFEALETGPHGWPFSPPVSRLIDRPSYARSLLNAAEGKGFGVVAWVVYLYNHVLARMRPQLAVRNAYGDANGAQLCPANPQVRSYALALTRAVLALGQFDRLHVESLNYLAYDYGFLGSKGAVVPGSLACKLLGLCFCEHCHSAATARGIDVARLKLGLRKWLDHDLNRLPDGESDEPQVPSALAANLIAFEEMREEIVLKLHREVYGLATEAGVRVSSNLAEDPSEGTDAGYQLRQDVDVLRVRMSPNMTEQECERVIAKVTTGPARNVPVYAFFNLAQFESEHSFHKALRVAVGAGLRHHGFYEYSLLSGRQIEWLQKSRGLPDH